METKLFETPSEQNKSTDRVICSLYQFDVKQGHCTLHSIVKPTIEIFTAGAISLLVMSISRKHLMELTIGKFSVIC